jgi:hypothetical protein
MWRRARSSAGEHYVDIVGVTGSIPVAPTTILPMSSMSIAHLVPLPDAELRRTLQEPASRFGTSLTREFLPTPVCSDTREGPPLCFRAKRCCACSHKILCPPGEFPACAARHSGKPLKAKRRPPRIRAVMENHAARGREIRRSAASVAAEVVALELGSRE